MVASDAQRRSIRAQAISIGLAISPFGLAFGALCAESGIGVWEALGFSSIVFGGSSQFAAVSVLADDGTVIAAITAGFGLPSKGGVVATMRGTPATDAVRTDMCADATIGNFPAGT